MQLCGILLVQACAAPGGSDRLASPSVERASASNALPHPAPARDRNGAEQLVLTAMGFLDTAYRNGGNSVAEGFDCSGFTRHVFDITLGLRLPRRADQQAFDDRLLAVSREDLLPGDLVFFQTQRHAFSHVGLYIGGSRFIHAPRTGAEVRIEDMATPYWTTRYNGARRSVGTSRDADPGAL